MPLTSWYEHPRKVQAVYNFGHPMRSDPRHQMAMAAIHGDIFSGRVTRPGKHTKNDGKSPCYSWENSLFRLGHGFNSFL